MRRLIVTCSLLAGLVVVGGVANAVNNTTDLNTLTPEEVAQSLVGSGVVISNVTFIGDNAQAGTFAADPGTIGFDAGVVLSSGNIADLLGPNSEDGVTTNYNGAGDADLSSLSGFNTFDAAVLEFEFVPNADTVFFSYVFASDEYNEFVNSSFNDVFGFFVNGTNCAVVDDGTGALVPITINTINNGNPFGTNATNPALYRNNDLDDGGGAINTEMDGLTTVLTCEASVNAGSTNVMKLAVADASDSALDSAVFLEQGSLTTTPGGSPMATKEGAVGTLEGLLPTGDKKADKYIGKAIEAIQDSLNPDYWVDETTLTKKGYKVFQEEKKAVNYLMKLEGDAAESVAPVIDALVAADQTLAQTAIDAAIAADAKQKYVDKALKEMDKALEELDKGKPDHAIEHYKHAWKKAQEALKKAIG